MQNIAFTTRSIWQQPSLVPSQFSAPFLSVKTNQWSQQVHKKKKKKKTTFLINLFLKPLEGFETEHFFFFFSLKLFS